jgi:hypothetical protein
MRPHEDHRFIEELCFEQVKRATIMATRREWASR